MTTPRCAFLAVLLALTCAGATPASARIIGRSAEISIGRETASLVEKYYRVDTDPVATARVRQIGRRLAASAQDPDFPFEFHVVEAAEVNAFALPGGFVYVFRGLLQLVPSDDALAFILAHEISHVTRHHSVKQFEKSLLLSAGITGILAGTGARGFGDAAMVVQELTALAFSRGDETDADTTGIELLARAGYNPRAAADAMALVKRATGGGREEPALLRSHPATDSRIKRLGELGNTILARRTAERARPRPELPPAPKAAARRLEGLEDERLAPCEWLPLVPGARWSYRSEADASLGSLEMRVLERLPAEPDGVFRVEYALAGGVRTTRLVAPSADRLVSRGEAPGSPPAWRLDALFGSEERLDGGGKLRFAGLEAVRVPAGEFQAAKVERLDAEGKIVSVAWYAQGIGLVRRSDPSGGSVQVLTAYSVPAAR